MIRELIKNSISRRHLCLPVCIDQGLNVGPLMDMTAFDNTHLDTGSTYTRRRYVHRPVTTELYLCQIFGAQVRTFMCLVTAVTTEAGLGRAQERQTQVRKTLSPIEVEELCAKALREKGMKNGREFYGTAKQARGLEVKLAAEECGADKLAARLVQIAEEAGLEFWRTGEGVGPRNDEVEGEKSKKGGATKDSRSWLNGWVEMIKWRAEEKGKGKGKDGYKAAGNMNQEEREHSIGRANHALRQTDWGVPALSEEYFLSQKWDKGGVLVVQTGPRNRVEEMLASTKEVDGPQQQLAIISLRQAIGYGRGRGMALPILRKGTVTMMSVRVYDLGGEELRLRREGRTQLEVQSDTHELGVEVHLEHLDEGDKAVLYKNPVAWLRRKLTEGMKTHGEWLVDILAVGRPKWTKYMGKGKERVWARIRVTKTSVEEALTSSGRNGIFLRPWVPAGEREETYRIYWVSGANLVQALEQSRTSGGLGVVCNERGFGIRRKREGSQMDTNTEERRMTMSKREATGIPVQLSREGVEKVLGNWGWRGARALRPLVARAGMRTWVVEAAQEPPSNECFLGASMVVVRKEEVRNRTLRLERWAGKRRDSDQSSSTSRSSETNRSSERGEVPVWKKTALGTSVRVEKRTEQETEECELAVQMIKAVDRIQRLEMNMEESVKKNEKM